MVDKRVSEILEIKNEIGLAYRRIKKILESIAEEIKNSEELRKEIGEFDVKVRENFCGDPSIEISVEMDLEYAGYRICDFVEKKYGSMLISFISLRRV